MSRVLISFLGTGPTDRQEYRVAKYRFDSKDIYETPFVAAALKQHYNIDRIILIGTMRSMWDCVYDYFGKGSGCFNIDIWERLYENRLNADHATSVEPIEYQQEVEEVLGNGSKVILTHYGLSNDEIETNSSIIIGLEQYLEDKDELIIDITHAFRSLPMYMMNLIIYLQNVSEKRLKITHISYGMLDVSQELGYTPIVELNSLLNVNDWISGAYSFKTFGNADKIAELVKAIDNKLSANLKQFSDTKNLNHLAELERQSQELGKMLRNKNLPPMAQMLITPVIEDFVKRLTVEQKDPYRHSKFQSKLARWQFNNKNYLAAYISILEAIVTYHVEAYQCWSGQNIDVYDKIERDAIKDKLKNYNETTISKEWKNLSREVSIKRNALAHNTKREFGPKTVNVTQSFIDNLEVFLGRYDNLTKEQ
ncbi:MAG: TIGR02221 family CRISPR-associated protein [Alistipes sp.]|nr:TIGR02221 family CRISPR-associated protein [Alistipes sp.]